jgi:hypothetical protein
MFLAGNESVFFTDTDFFFSTVLPLAFEVNFFSVFLGFFAAIYKPFTTALLRCGYSIFLSIVGNSRRQKYNFLKKISKEKHKNI